MRIIDINPEYKEFLKAAVYTARRISAHAGEFFPVYEGVTLALTPEGGLLGARVLFEPPCKSVWVPPRIESAVYGSYDQDRKLQTPLTATLILMEVDIDSNVLYNTAAIYENPVTS